MKISTDGLMVLARRESGDMVPYGSTTAQLPDNVWIEFHGMIEVTVSARELAEIDNLSTAINDELRTLPIQAGEEGEITISYWELVRIKVPTIEEITLVLEPLDHKWV